MMHLRHIFLILFLIGMGTLSLAANEKPFIHTHLKGRLGNQMFQVAAALSLALDHDAEPIFPDLVDKEREIFHENHKIFFKNLNVTRPPVPPIYTFHENRHFRFAPIKYKPNMSIEGYFQSEDYFKRHKKEICALFEPSESIKRYLKEKYPDILSHPNTVAIHMRAYKIENPGIEKCFPFLCGRYFKKAARLFPKDALFVIFSDRIGWAKREMRNFNRPHVFITKETYYHDFYLMSFCKHQIISPSTFSWWAAYLNKNPDKKVVAPFPWFSPASGHDSSRVVPKGWIKFPWQNDFPSNPN